MAENKSNKKVANSLVAMSSAAVLAVYTAGFVRTRPAANRVAYERFVGQAVPERATRDADVPPAVPSRVVAARSSTLAAPEQPTSSVAAPAPAETHSPRNVAQTASKAVTTPLPAGTPAAASKASAASSVLEPAATDPQAALSKTQPGSAESASGAAAQSAVATPSVSAPAATAPAATASAAAPATPASTPAATAPAAPAQPVWKDGKYTAWGTCQHGDIQATVVIQGGRIISADITNCQTRYSCDVIENLPAKVITRQKAKFDTVGGATESAYAYYGAVYWALDQASK